MTVTQRTGFKWFQIELDYRKVKCRRNFKVEQTTEEIKKR